MTKKIKEEKMTGLRARRIHLFFRVPGFLVPRAGENTSDERAPLVHFIINDASARPSAVLYLRDKRIFVLSPYYYIGRADAYAVPTLVRIKIYRISYYISQVLIDAYELPVISHLKETRNVSRSVTCARGRSDEEKREKKRERGKK